MHNPVLLEEVCECLSPREGGVYIDATFGAGGYTSAILNQAHCKVYAIDRDHQAEEIAGSLSSTFGGRFQFALGEFSKMHNLLPNIGLVDGIVFDIGVSSMQLDQAERGFSFNKDGPLDMRMNRRQQLTAADLIATCPEEELADIIYKYGGERKSRRVANAIVQARTQSRIETTGQLAEIVLSALGNYKDDIHPATRTFQALRIVINDELNQLEAGLKSASNMVAIGGKIVVVTFHSLEDRIVKEYFNKLCGRVANINRHLPLLKENSIEPSFTLYNRKVIIPGINEVRNNPRARSAKLRAITRVR
jgi:16S rRNA (cytosine1402-N4)-methyltransferase